MANFFDRDAFLNTSVGKQDDKVIPLDEGDRENCYIDKWDLASGEGKDGKPWLALDIKVKVPLSEEEKAIYRREHKIVSMDRIFLDCDWSDPSNPVLLVEPQTNIGLGRLRTAVKQNYSDWSIPHLEGAGPFVARVIQKVQNGGEPFNRVSRVMEQ